MFARASTLLWLGIGIVAVAPVHAADLPTAPVVPAALPAPPAFEVSVTPYVWVASIEGSLSLRSSRRPDEYVTADFSASFADTISHLDGVPFMGAADIRFGRFALAFDLIYTPVEQDFGTRDLLFRGGQASLTNTLATALVYYRLIDDPGFSLELGGGVRHYEFRTTLSLNPGLLPAETASRTFAWNDPVVAGRFRVALPHNFAISVYGDVGGFGAGSDLSWQVAGTLDYAITPTIDLRIGYRYLSVDYTAGRAEVDLRMHGPVIAATFRF